MKKTAIIEILALLAVLVISTTSAAAASEYYLTPQDSSVPEYCQTTEVGLWINATEPIQSGFVEINYTFCCANITDYSPDTSYFEDNGGVFVPGQLRVGFSHKEGIMPTNRPAGVYHIGNFTIHCCNDETTYCKTDLLFTDSLLGRIEGAAIVSVLHTSTNGTFTCEEPEPEQCLGMCYEGTVCEGTPIEKMSCSACLAMADTSWLNDPCPVSACGCTCDSMCWNESIGGCPECCDGVDNDGVNGTDWPADPQCGCCIDGNETDGTDSCPDPCVPELPTLALAGIGILGIALLARKRD